MVGESAKGSIKELLSRSLELGLGAVVMTKESVQKMVDEMIAKGSVPKEEGKHLVGEILEKGHQGRVELEGFLSNAVERALTATDLARRSDLHNLRVRVGELEARVAKLELQALEEPPAAPEAEY